MYQRDSLTKPSSFEGASFKLLPPLQRAHLQDCSWLNPRRPDAWIAGIMTMLGFASFIATAVLLAACDKVAPFVLAPQLGSHFAEAARSIWVACAVLGVPRWCMPRQQAPPRFPDEISLPAHRLSLLRSAARP